MKINIIYGPPGTGKTTELLKIVENELKTVDPHDIAFASFTKKGCYEGVERAKKNFKLSKSDLPYFRTIHSLAFRYLNFNKNDMIQFDNYRELGRILDMNFSGFLDPELIGKDDAYLHFEQLYRNNKKYGEKKLNELNPRLTQFVVKNYREYKRRKNIFDFTDLLEMYLKRGEPLDCKVAIIDEAQDLTSLQWAVVWKLFRNVERIYIAGDDDQAIYEWSGADVNYFLNLKGETKILNQSYRLPKAVHDYSMNISGSILNRIDKEFKPSAEVGQVEMISTFEEITYNSEESFLFLSRNKRNLKPVEKLLKDKGFVFTIHGKSSIRPELIKAIKDFSKGDFSNENKIIYQKYCKKEVDYTVPWYEAFTNLKAETITYYRDLISNKRSLTSNIVLSTIHAAKGGESDNVILLLDFSLKVYKNYKANPDSEMRVYYVGASRARKKLFIKSPDTKNHYPKFF